ncbi:hypothetical protein S7711_11362 [Stachybotrys chartarum IBT 7711]|uniref:Uncharacterized protein n=1 Tax=Stachybotrys chartarum (strain CBS 109288 / IBT 7711) TaxID=1280523 RepID=A0A084AHP5_STACB|nr:hypothetical protein S7711_11362 [Stachybotrys chartarum IBT 7711]
MRNEGGEMQESGELEQEDTRSGSSNVLPGVASVDQSGQVVSIHECLMRIQPGPNVKNAATLFVTRRKHGGGGSSTSSLHGMETGNGQDGYNRHQVVDIIGPGWPQVKQERKPSAQRLPNATSRPASPRLSKGQIRHR